MEKDFLIFSDVTNFHKVSSFQQRKKKTHPEDLAVGLCKLLFASQASHNQEVYWLNRY